jgi:hypothetical protein
MAWYKGNLHMHSYWSDGHNFPEMIADWFKSAGYDFIAFTEHDQHQVGEKWVSCDVARGSGRSMKDGDLLQKYKDRFGASWVDVKEEGKGSVRVKPLSEYRHLVEVPGQFLVITGEEVTTTWGGDKDVSRMHWINVFNTPEAVEPQHDFESSERAMQATLRATRSLGLSSGADVLVFLNHPNFAWNATAESIAAVEDLRHIEIYTALNMCNTFGDESHCSAERIWDVALTLRLKEGGDLIYGLATDDCHTYAHHWELGDTALPGRAWVCVQADGLTPEHILGAVNCGNYYCSSGVTLNEVVRDNDRVALEIQPREGVHYTTRFIGTPLDVDLSSEVVRNADGELVRTTRRYSEEMGQVLYETMDLHPSYTFTGNESYVRAVVTSDSVHPNPTGPGDYEKAWTQPVVPGKL